MGMTRARSDETDSYNYSFREDPDVRWQSAPRKQILAVFVERKFLSLDVVLSVVFSWTRPLRVREL